MMITDCLSGEARKARFARICTEMLHSEHEKGLAGVGTLQEKRLHATIKRYLSENEDEHEVGILNTKYVADVLIDGDVFEVQTGGFLPMKAKIAHYLKNTELTVTIVHPIAVNRWVSKIDPKTGEVGIRRKSPRHGKACDILAEMYPLLEFLPNSRLQFRVLLLDVQDFRYATGKQRGERFERVPLALIEDLELTAPQSFRIFLPSNLPQIFTVKQFSLLTGLRGIDAYSAVRVLCGLGLLRRAGKLGRSMAFCKL